MPEFRFCRAKWPRPVGRRNSISLRPRADAESTEGARRLSCARSALKSTLTKRVVRGLAQSSSRPVRAVQRQKMRGGKRPDSPHRPKLPRSLAPRQCKRGQLPQMQTLTAHLTTSPPVSMTGKQTGRTRQTVRTQIPHPNPGPIARKQTAQPRPTLSFQTISEKMEWPKWVGLDQDAHCRRAAEQLRIVTGWM
jgi:hypothetical protein